MNSSKFCDKLIGRVPIRNGMGAGYPLQSFFTEADKKRIFVPIPHAPTTKLYSFSYKLCCWTSSKSLLCKK